MKRLFAFILCLAICMVSLSVSSVAFAAYSGSNFTSNQNLASKLTKLLNGEVSVFTKPANKYKVGDVFPKDTTFYWPGDNGKQCYAYANAAYYYLFGDSPQHGNSSYSKSKIVSGVKGKNKLTFDIFANAGIGCGAWLRTTGNSSGSYNGSDAHSIIILSYNTSQVVFLHAARKVSDGPYYIQLSAKSWDDFNSYLFTPWKGKKRYVCAMLQPNLTAGTNMYKSVCNYKGVFKFKKDDDCRKGPAESYAKVKDMKTNTIIFVVQKVVNKYGNTWYKMENGYYVYCGDVSKVNLTTTSLSGTYVFTKDDESRTWPYEASKKVKSYSKGSTVKVTKKVVNSYNNIWYQLDTGAYVYSGDVKKKTTSTPTTVSLEFQNVVYPSTFRINTSQGWYLQGGTVTSGIELASITSKIVNSSGTVISGPKTRTISGKSYNVKNLDTMESADNGVKFSKIKTAGNYKWILTVKDTAGHSLTMEMPFKAVSSGSTVTSKKSAKYSSGSASNSAFTKEDKTRSNNIVIDGLKYKLNISKKTASFTGSGSKDTKSITIPSKILYDGEEYQVVKIAKNACKGMKKLEKLIIGKNVSRIEENAFKDCKNLKTIIIKTEKLTAEKIDKNAFKNINKKVTIQCPSHKLKDYKKFLMKKGMPKKAVYK